MLLFIYITPNQINSCIKMLFIVRQRANNQDDPL